MDRSKLIERLMATFLGELGEHVRGINDDLLALEKGPRDPERAERFKTLFRAAHSLKGASRSVNVNVIEDACHRLEEILGAARDGTVPLNPDLFSLLFATADALEEAGMRLREQQDLTDSPLAALLPRLEDGARGLVSPPSPSSLPPAPAPVPPPSPAQASSPPPAPISPPQAVVKDAPPVRPQDSGETTRVATPAAPSPVPVPVPSPSAAAAPTDSDKTYGGASVRVSADKLDAMLTRSGELLVARRSVESRVDEIVTLREFVGRWRDEWRGAAKPLAKLLPRDGEEREVGPLPRRILQMLARTGDHLLQLEKVCDRIAAKMTRDRRQLVRAADLLDEEVRRVRMLPFADACQGLDRSVRDVARAGSKQVELVVEGGRVELDRSVLEGLKDPLVHLVRNAVDHGIEIPEERRAAGKPPQGRVTVTAALRGTHVEVVVADDGNGIDMDVLREQARKRGFGEFSDDRDLLDVIFLPGFSTASIITNISGRGVGLDVVKSRLETLHGTIGLASTPGQGTRFTLAVPLTLTTLRALLVKAGGQFFAMAGGNVQRLVRVDAADFRTVEGRDMLTLGGPPLPVTLLAEALGLPSREPMRPGVKMPGLIVAAGERRMVFVVDELLTEQEVIVKSLGARIKRVRNLSGATILPSGRIALVLNAAGLVRNSMGRSAAMPAALRAKNEASAAARKRLLVVDDSVTTRTLEKSILEAAGYQVETAVDGAAGWEVLLERGADLVISDVDMPRMDGFALTETIRASSRFAELPIVLFSSRASERDKARGIEVGADAYIVKGAFDQKDLLETVAQLL